MKTSIIIFICLLIQNVTFAQNAKGCIPDIIDTNMVKLKDFSGLRAPLPSSYSLEAYAPAVGDQGNLGSCTSWATNYCAFTMVKRIESGNNYLTPFSALDLHNRIKASNGEPPCSDGARISEALQILQSYGAGRDYYSCSYASANKYYNDRLYDWDLLSLSITDVKKALFEKNPVVIAAYCYQNDWGLTSNHVNGVWNGYSGGAADGGHAMCVIAYDDYKYGGAFKIQNSWGTSWGTGGYFWIKYSDFFKTVYQAFAVSPKPGNYQSDDVFGEQINADYFRVQNNCSLTVYVSVSQNINGGVETDGWYSVASGSSIDINISDRYTNEFYWMATANYNGSYIDWYDANGSNRCFSRDRHHMEGAYSSYCPEMKPYYRDEPSSGTYYHLRTLSCPNVTTRGGEIQFSAANSIAYGSPQLNNENDNKNWNTGPLIDLYTGKQIQEVTENGETFYAVFYLKKGKIIEFKGSKEELSKLRYLKFSSKQSAEYWLKLGDGN
jgi:hypothetical protein